ncbi:hypothetical protein HPP92_015876 [Vanilla planifolia]|uniref:Uncharacterized protein n=1 Tax=Vanilla planifolia TaxID=51239 RepID=A0A835QK06_VANPL|nr:hypothetical protein HPP92_015876 [Vanilla planifolia]
MEFMLAQAAVEKARSVAERFGCVVFNTFLKQAKDDIQPVINHALLSLPTKKHIKFISHAAILQFKCGVPEVEGPCLRAYCVNTQREQMWSIYLDQEIRLGDHEVIRALFERATCLSLPPKKMKNPKVIKEARA